MMTIAQIMEKMIAFSMICAMVIICFTPVFNT